MEQSRLPCGRAEYIYFGEINMKRDLTFSSITLLQRPTQEDTARTNHSYLV